MQEAIAESDAVIHLAGEPVLGKRWSEKQKARLLASRVETTAALVAAIEASSTRPKVLISASGIDFYQAGDTPTSETHPKGNSFLAEVCDQWESEARKANALGVRTVQLRIGVVLGLEGGVLGKLIPLFLAGLGGKLGSGKQWMSWIHLEDLLEVMRVALHDERFEGAINCTSPAPIQNHQFTRDLARALQRPAFLPAPFFALRIALGEASTVVTASRRMDPARLQELGFQFGYPTLEKALEHLVGYMNCIEFDLPDSRPESDYLQKRGARYRLRTTTILDGSLDTVFPFFSRAENLGVITPASLGFTLKNDPPENMAVGIKIHYTILVGPIRIPWETTFNGWNPPESFIDVQTGGPYRSWWHKHTFEPQGDTTRMDDCVYYQPPLGWLGRMANYFFVKNMLKRIFGFRAQAMALRFGPKRKR